MTLLSKMGITMDDTGELTFDASQFSSVSASDLDQFLGSRTGGGFLQTATNAMNAVEDPTTGFIPTATNNIQWRDHPGERPDHRRNTQKIADSANYPHAANGCRRR